MMASTIHNLPPSVPVSLTALFAVGAVVMRGAGCTINDMWDEKFDRAVGGSGVWLLCFLTPRADKMEAIGSGRCDPLPSSHVPRSAAVRRSRDPHATEHVYVSHWFIHIGTVLTVRIGLGVASMGLVTIYPFMKRITYYPQITFGQTLPPHSGFAADSQARLSCGPF